VTDFDPVPTYGRSRGQNCRRHVGRRCGVDIFDGPVETLVTESVGRKAGATFAREQVRNGGLIGLRGSGCEGERNRSEALSLP
jgi:hypothetical protein